MQREDRLRRTGSGVSKLDRAANFSLVIDVEVRTRDEGPAGIMGLSWLITSLAYEYCCQQGWAISANRSDVGRPDPVYTFSYLRLSQVCTTVVPLMEDEYCSSLVGKVTSSSPPLEAYIVHTPNVSALGHSTPRPFFDDIAVSVLEQGKDRRTRAV
jgi:hypothetical protein